MKYYLPLTVYKVRKKLLNICLGKKQNTLIKITHKI